MTHKELKDTISAILCDVNEKFSEKNSNYASGNDAFYNFRETARRLLQSESPVAMVKVLMIYMDKHWTTLTKNGIHDTEFVDRFQDIIVYSLIALAIKREAEAIDLPRDISGKIQGN